MAFTNPLYSWELQFPCANTKFNTQTIDLPDFFPKFVQETILI